jgi:hypothetical protein
MNRLPEDVEKALETWVDTRQKYIGQRVRYTGKSLSIDWPLPGDVGTIVDLSPANGHGMAPFLIRWDGVPFNIQPTLDSIELVETI